MDDALVPGATRTAHTPFSSLEFQNSPPEQSETERIQYRYDEWASRKPVSSFAASSASGCHVLRIRSMRGLSTCRDESCATAQSTVATGFTFAVSKRMITKVWSFTIGAIAESTGCW